MLRKSIPFGARSGNIASRGNRHGNQQRKMPREKRQREKLYRKQRRKHRKIAYVLVATMLLCSQFTLKAVSLLTSPHGTLALSLPHVLQLALAPYARTTDRMCTFQPNLSPTTTNRIPTTSTRAFSQQRYPTSLANDAHNIITVRIGKKERRAS